MEPDRNIEITIAKFYEEFGAQFRKNVLFLRENGHQQLAGEMQRLMYGIFYNDPRHTLRRGKVYLIGLNPGGGSDGFDFSQEKDNIESMEWWRRQSPKGGKCYSAYIDEEWGSGPGNTPHQSNVRKVLHAVTEGESEEDDTRSAFAANLCFYRTPSANDLYAYPNWPDLVKECWGFHQRFLSIVRPEMIVCNGNGESFSAFSEVRRQFGVETNQAEPVNRRRSLKWFRGTLPVEGGGEVLVVGVPHLSQPYASIDDICSAIKRIQATI